MMNFMEKNQLKMMLYQKQVVIEMLTQPQQPMMRGQIQMMILASTF
jgi:hypothetical protein